MYDWLEKKNRSNTANCSSVLCVQWYIPYNNRTHSIIRQLLRRFINKKNEKHSTCRCQTPFKKISVYVYVHVYTFVYVHVQVERTICISKCMCMCICKNMNTCIHSVLRNKCAKYYKIILQNLMALPNAQLQKVLLIILVIYLSTILLRTGYMFHWYHLIEKVLVMTTKLSFCIRVVRQNIREESGGFLNAIYILIFTISIYDMYWRNAMCNMITNRFSVHIVSHKIYDVTCGP